MRTLKKRKFPNKPQKNNTFFYKRNRIEAFFSNVFFIDSSIMHRYVNLCWHYARKYFFRRILMHISGQSVWNKKNKLKLSQTILAISYGITHQQLSNTVVDTFMLRGGGQFKKKYLKIFLHIKKCSLSLKILKRFLWTLLWGFLPFVSLSYFYMNFKKNNISLTKKISRSVGN